MAKNYKISEFFSRKDFSCKCGKCDNEFKMSLTLIGIMEHLRAKFKNRINIQRGYICEELSKELFGNAKDWHHYGKAVDINVDNIPLGKVFKEIESMQEPTNIGFCPNDNHIHIDLREKDREVWIRERNEKMPLTNSKRNQYNIPA